VVVWGLAVDQQRAVKGVGNGRRTLGRRDAAGQPPHHHHAHNHQCPSTHTRYVLPI